jgi:hypothetical protein
MPLVADHRQIAGAILLMEDVSDAADGRDGG